MARIYLSFLWHMHQPFYKDLVSGEYRLPWTRMHALKDYYGMVRLLEEFPTIRQTFNLVPSMMVQIDEYARGVAKDPFLQVAVKPAEDLTEAEQTFLLQNSFHANPERLIYRYPRYGELHDAWQSAHRDAERARRSFGVRALRDLQMWSQLAWFDEEFQDHDPQVRELIARGRDFTRDDQALMARKQKEIVAAVAPEYRKLAASGQIEISTTPFYHPILPLLCDSNIAAVSHPGVTLPSRFQYPGDARAQLEMARDYITREFGAAPVGLWPSEGSVSDEVFTLAAEAGFKWAATDSGVLDRTLGHGSGIDGLYRPYRWKQGSRSMNLVFRDHFLSDLIGFVYSKMGAAEAADDFLNRIRENCAPILAQGRDALVPVILDGENAWEYFHLNGRPFLRELYTRIAADAEMQAITVGESFARIEPRELSHIFPASWISANFDIWIGPEEDNRAWEHVLRARETYDQMIHPDPGLEDDDQPVITEAARALAWQELLIAEGSDWCWWYGPHHDTAHRAEFDQLFRDHVANVYRALGLAPPEDLSRPIIQKAVTAVSTAPTGRVKPVIDGEVSSYFEWLGAGLYEADSRQGAMHGNRRLVSEVRFGSDGEHLFVRVDFTDNDTSGVEVRLNLQDAASPRSATVTVRLVDGHTRVTASAGLAARAEYRTVLEMSAALEGIGVMPGAAARFQLSLWQDGLPIDAVPPQGWFEVPTEEFVEWRT